MNNELEKFFSSQNTIIESKLKQYLFSSIGEKLPSRFLYHKLEGYINDFIEKKTEKRWVVIPGLRGTGKTTLLAQLYFYILKKYKKNADLLYISLDEAKEYFQLNLLDLIKYYEENKSKRFEELDRPLFIFLDEVQIYENWAKLLKTIYDRSKQVFIFCSGSSALELQTTADVARRALIEKLHPLSFTEYQILKNNIYPPDNIEKEIFHHIYNSDNITDINNSLNKLKIKVDNYFSKIPKDSIDNYLCNGTMPFTLLYNDEAYLYKSLDSLLDKIIKNDIAIYGKLDRDTTDSIKRILFILSDSENISLTKLSELLHLNKLTISRILEYLEQSEILIRVFPYGGNIKKVRKPSKYLFMTPAIRASLYKISGLKNTFNTRRGKLLEDIFGLHFYKEFLIPNIGSVSYDSSNECADFILQILNKKQIAIEVGIGNKGIKQVINSMNNIKCNYGVVFSNDPLFIDESTNIIKIPLNYFLLI